MRIPCGSSQPSAHRRACRSADGNSAIRLDSPSLTTLYPKTIFTTNFAATRPLGSSRLKTEPNCVFCQIVAGRSPAKVRYVDNDIIVIVNRLVRDEPDPWWPPVMLLVMPKEHLSQFQMWDSGLLPRLGRLAVDMGAMFAPRGFRVVSNFGKDGEQTQSHGHLHVVGGVYLGHYLEHDVVYSANRAP